MPYTAEERLERKRDSNRRWRAANPERARAASRRWYADNLEWNRAYREANPERERRSSFLRSWERANVNPWPYASLAELHDDRYIVAEHCEYCGPRWGNFATLALTSRISPRNMEHDHRPPFLFRAISCHRCNISRGYWDRRILAVITELTPRYLRWWRRRHRTSPK